MLFSQIQLGVHSIWLKTPDIHRSIESILNFPNRTYFQIDSENGFSQYIDNEWLPVLVQMQDQNNPGQFIEAVTYDFIVAYHHILSNRSSIKNPTIVYPVISKHEELLSSYIGLIYSGQKKYRDSFWQDDLDSMPVQMIFVSNKDLPQDFANYLFSEEFDYPNLVELSDILSHIEKATDSLVFDSSKKQEIAKAGLGLDECSFINICLNSVVKNGTIDSEYVYSTKMSNIKKHGILEIKKPKITFDNIGGLDAIKNIITKNSILWHNPEKAKEFGIKPISRLLMVGVPGTGKSAICEATANALNLDLARTGVSQVMNSFVGQSEANMRAVFQQINAMAPLCVWIDEFGRDLSGGASSSHVDGGTTDRVHGEFLTGLQELPDNVFLMCAANQLDNLRPEMLRADRFDKIMFVGLPSFSERLDIIKIYLSDIETDFPFNYEHIAEVTQYFTGAEIKGLIKEVKFNVALSEMRQVNTRDIVDYAPKVRNILWNKSRPMIQDLYATALEQWDWASTEQFNDAKLILNRNVSSNITPNASSKKQLQWSSK